MRRYGRDYDAGYYPRGQLGRYDRGYREGWGMVGLNESILQGPRPGRRGYDHAIHGRPGGEFRARPARRPFPPNPYDRLYVPRDPYGSRRF